jgi:hypothetical protein
VEVPKVQEHLADQFVLQTMIIIILKIIGIFARLELKINQNFVLLCFRWADPWRRNVECRDSCPRSLQHCTKPGK